MMSKTEIPSRAELARLLGEMREELNKPAMSPKEEFDFLYNPESEDREAFENLSSRIKAGLAHHREKEPEFDPEY